MKQPIVVDGTYSRPADGSIRLSVGSLSAQIAAEGRLGP
jgi:hypothetical protein